MNELLIIFSVPRHHRLEEGCGTVEGGVEDPGDEGQRCSGSAQDRDGRASRDKVTISPTLYKQLLHAKNPIAHKRQSSQAGFCAFGICARKSCAKTRWWNWPLRSSLDVTIKQLSETRQEIEKTRNECQDFMKKFREEEDARIKWVNDVFGKVPTLSQKK